MNNRKSSRFLKYAVVLAIFLGLAYYGYSVAADHKVVPKVSTIINYTQKTSPAINNQLVNKLQSDWKTIVASQNGSVDIAVYDSKTGQIAHYTNTGGTFNTASTVKLSILEEVLLQDQKTNQAITSSQLAQATPMIENSNNDAASDLWNDVGGAAAMNSFFQQIGATSTTAGTQGEWGLTQTTALDQLKVVNALAYPGKYLDQASANQADELLNNVETNQTWGVSGGVPSGVSVQLKNGWLTDNQTNPSDQYSNTSDWLINSIGHVHGDGVDYTIAVYTDGDSTEQEGINLVQSLSATTWKDIY